MTAALRRTARHIINKKSIIPISTRTKSTEENVLKSVYSDVEEPNCTVNQFVWQSLHKYHDKTFTVCALTGRSYTYEQTHRMSLSFAASLRIKLKLQNDDKVAIMLPNVPEYPSVALGVMEAGCIVSMVNPAYTVDELKRQLQIIECKVIVSSKYFVSNISQALKDLKWSIPIILIDNEGVPEGTILYSEFAGNRSIDTDCLKAVTRSSKDIAILPFSSGTTGFAKAVELTHNSMTVLNRMVLDPKIVSMQDATESFQSVVPAVLPFYHIFGFNAIMLNLMSVGVKLVTMPIFKAELFLESLIRHKAHHLYLVPPMLIFLGKHPSVTAKHLDSVKEIICGAAPVSESDAKAIMDKKKNLIFRQGYGLTETNGGISIGFNGNKNHDSVGFIFGSGEVKIADVNTQEALGHGKEGEIWYRGPNVMTGYYKNEAATKEVITEDGWFKTGDIGKYDENKFLYVTDRLKELIKVKGFQVPPAELEMILRTHPKVLDCAVLGVPDPISGEVPKAFVVVQDGQTVKPEEVLEHVNEKVVSYKKIKEIQFVKTIPKSPAGKILRKQLKETN